MALFAENSSNIITDAFAFVKLFCFNLFKVNRNHNFPAVLFKNICIFEQEQISALFSFFYKIP